MKTVLIGLVLLAAAVTTFVGQASEDAAMTMDSDENLAVATFAGGCFWCVEAGFDKVPGVVKTISGFTGGHVANPSYKQVSNGGTGHLESVEVYYDPRLITYQGLLAAFWRMIDPTDDGGQFVDRGHQYTTAIFYHTEQQKVAAQTSRDALAASGRYHKPIVTAIRPAEKFYAAEEHHQDFHIKSPLRYKFYRYRSGRDQYLEKTWGKDIHVDYGQYSSIDEGRLREISVVASIIRAAE